MIFILYFVIIFGFSPFLYFIVAKRQSVIELKAIIPFIILTFISSLYELLGTLTFGWNISYWFILYNVLSFFCVFYFYYDTLQKRYSLLFTICIAAFFVLSYFLFQRYSFEDFFEVNSYFKTFVTIFVLLFSILWFMKLFAESYIDNLLRYSTFYFISGFVLYYCGTLFLFLLSNHLHKLDSSSFQSYWLLNILLNFVLRTLLLVGLWMARTK
jgi:hypothetical protein